MQPLLGTFLTRISSAHNSSSPVSGGRASAGARSASQDSCHFCYHSRPSRTLRTFAESQGHWQHLFPQPLTPTTDTSHKPFLSLQTTANKASLLKSLPSLFRPELLHRELRWPLRGKQGERIRYQISASQIPLAQTPHTLWSEAAQLTRSKSSVRSERQCCSQKPGH